MIFRKIGVVICFLSFCLTGFAQSSATKKADQEFKNRGYYDAARMYKQAEPSAKKLDQKARIFYQLGECYRLVADYQQSLEWYEKAITAQYFNTNNELYLNYGLSLMEMGRWDDAVVQFNKYTAKGGAKNKVEGRIKGCQDAASKKNSKVKFLVENMIDLNSAFFDLSLSYAQGKADQIVFTSSRQASAGAFVDPITGESFMDIFYSERDKKGKWSTPQPLAGKVNSSGSEGASSFTKDGNSIYFTLCRYEGEKMWYACDIMRATKEGNNFGEPVNMNIIDRNTDDTTVVGHPFVTADGKYLLFASDLAGGKGGKDIWYCTIDPKSSSIGKITNMGGINTPGDDMFPYIADDGTFYYSSNGHTNGLGGLDIYKATKSGNEMSYANASPLEYPVNTSSNDFAMVLDPKKDGVTGLSGFFSSDRPGGKGKDDIYHFVENSLEFSITATVYDQDNGSPVSGASVSLVGTSDSGDPINLKVTTDPNGGFSFDKTQIKANYLYTIDVQKEKFIGRIEKLSTIGYNTSTNFAREIFIIPIPDPLVKGGGIEMPEVRYDLGKAELQVNATVNSKDSLNYLYEILVANPKLVIQLESHTDARDSDENNLKLSQARSQSCVDYLVKEKGIDANRIIAKGMGESEPRILKRDYAPLKKGDELTEDFIKKLASKDVQEKAHQLNRRTMFRVIRTDYVPSK